MTLEDSSIKFEIGDVVYCTYYKIKGIITGLSNGYIMIKNPISGAGCSAKVRTVSASRIKPFYLQMICKKADYDAAANNIFIRDE